MLNPKVSIIIPVGKPNKNLSECLDHCLQLDYLNYEIIVLPDDEWNFPNDQVKIIPTGHIGPSEKRDIGIGHAEGEIIALLDDDAYPVKNWLKAAIKNFADKETAAVGGPAVTPKNDSLLQKASGFVYSSRIVAGNYVYRYLPRERRKVDDYPTCNLIIRKDILREIGGFNTKFWPGEDTVICLNITKKLRKKIIYDPDVLVYHHRRCLFIPHLRQILNYALHRGYFVKRFPETSLRLSYFLPSLLIIWLFSGWMIGLINPKLYILYPYTISLYLLLVIISSLKGEGIWSKIAIGGGIILSHIVYGMWFIKGMMTERLREE